MVTNKWHDGDMVAAHHTIDKHTRRPTRWLGQEAPARWLGTTSSARNRLDRRNTMRFATYASVKAATAAKTLHDEDTVTAAPSRSCTSERTYDVATARGSRKRSTAWIQL